MSEMLKVLKWNDYDITINQVKLFPPIYSKGLK